MMTKIVFLFAAAAGGLAVVLGAFGAHGLRGKVEDRLIETFQTAVEYQMFHALALLLIALFMQLWGRSLSLDIAACALMLGVVLFSGSLYGLVLTEMKWLGPVTPVGGLCFIVGWIALFYYGTQKIG